MCRSGYLQKGALYITYEVRPPVQFVFVNIKYIFRFSPQEVIKVDAVLGMITPIGVQMEYDRERVSVFYFRYTSCVRVTRVTLTFQA